MRILYICNLDCRNKAGVYNATINRLNYMKKDTEILVTSLLSTDSKSLRILKKIIRKSTNYFNIGKYSDGDISWENLIYKNSIYSIFNKEFNFERMIEYYVNKLEKKYDFKNIDLIHVHWGFPNAEVARILKERYKIPYVVTSHGSDIHTNPYLNNIIKEKTLSGLNDADALMFVSRDLAKKAIGLGVDNKIYITPNGICDEFLLDNIPKRNVKKKIGYLGNLITIKGADRIPKIFSIINKKVKCEFEIIGDGELREKVLKELDDLKIKYKYYGRVNHQRVKAILKDFDILIIPSRNEGWPVVVLEANGLGVYVVGTNVGGVPEAIGNIGSVVNIEDNDLEESLGREVIRVLEKGYDSKILRNRAREYTWDNIVKLEKEIYINVINKKYDINHQSK